MKKENVKNFIKQHKWEIINGTVGAVLVSVAFYSGYLYCIKVIDDAVTTYANCLKEY